MIKVLIVDDEPLARENLVILLQEQSDIEIVGNVRMPLRPSARCINCALMCCFSISRCHVLAVWKWWACSILNTVRILFSHRI